MQYAICNKAKSVQAGFVLIGHRCKEDEILLNEKEILNNPNLTGTLDERVESLGGTLYSTQKAILYIKKNNWK